ncbi:MAG: hypothetical protein A3K19_19180 [Lentisphaerae bacterium RIFOXYB12_FULL_65_16]|nr:MAG: hypothetical protein A3K18_02220 [Lentisphaerae bacterium RIFOXYA12_64_32]OGV91578.1 MAG: hypothetical protein A3K19_19180 [Lentisphaerae bacterium RIFOXYB12_FULL_65_16]
MCRLDRDPRLEDRVVVEAVPEEVAAEELLVRPQKLVLAEALGLRHLVERESAHVDERAFAFEAVVAAPKRAPCLLDRLAARVRVLLGEVAQDRQVRGAHWVCFSFQYFQVATSVPLL